VVFEEGDDGQSMYVVVQGSFEVYRRVDGQHIDIADIGPGEHFGEIALLASRPRTASVRALDDCIALRFTKQAIFADPNTAAYLFRNMAALMAERLVHANEEIILHKTGKQGGSFASLGAPPSTFNRSRERMAR
jgi:CRP/FNR family transcriptional regulator, cyclic AMP receptor protein